MRLPLFFMDVVICMANSSRPVGSDRVKVSRFLPSLLALALLYGCVTVAEKEALELLPMYGQPELQRTGYLDREDRAFVRQTGARYQGDLKQAGRDWSEQAFRVLQLGDADGAMRRLNRAWLLDPDNYQVYWGFAQVLVVKGETDQALPHLQRALLLIDDAYQKPALLSDLGSVYSLLAERAEGTRSDSLYARANASFSEAVKLDGGFAPAWYRWAQSYYRQGDYAAAWKTVRLARGQGVDRFPGDFIQTLSDRQAPPDS
mgnify:CR=1 FL=1